MPRYYMLNKPRGLLSACADERCDTVLSCINEDEREGLFHVGRLDKDTEGMLILTDDGALCHRLMHPDNKVKKTYYFLCRGVLSEEKISQLESGVCIYKNEGNLTRPASIRIISTQPIGDVLHLLNDIDKKKVRGKGYHSTIGTITISEGKKHQVRRMLRGVDCYVYYLKRIKIGALSLDDNLKIGEYRPLSEAEISLLNQNQ